MGKKLLSYKASKNIHKENLKVQRKNVHLQVSNNIYMYFPDGLAHIMAWWPEHFILDFIYKISKCIDNVFVLKL